MLWHTGLAHCLGTALCPPVPSFLAPAAGVLCLTCHSQCVGAPAVVHLLDPGWAPFCAPDSCLPSCTTLFVCSDKHGLLSATIYPSAYVCQTWQWWHRNGASRSDLTWSLACWICARRRPACFVRGTSSIAQCASTSVVVASKRGNTVEACFKDHL